MALENTIASFRAALDAGIDGLELDLHRTADGVLAVYHDPSIDGDFLSEHSWSDLSAKAPQTPRFEEVLELLDEYPSARLNIELKHAVPSNDDRESLLAEVLGAWSGSAKERAWISSFDPYSLLRLRREGADLPLALLVSEEEALELLPCLSLAGVHPHYSLLSPERISRWHEQGLFVFAWTVNDLALGARLLDWGADGLIGDDPELLLRARDRDDSSGRRRVDQ